MTRSAFTARLPPGNPSPLPHPLRLLAPPTDKKAGRAQGQEREGGRFGDGISRDYSRCLLNGVRN